MAKYDLSIREEELKNKVARDWFSNYDTTQIIDNIDFVIAIQPNGNEIFKDTEYLLWAEAKKGNKQNIYDSVIQLIFTIGKGRINEKHMPPKYIGAFDAEKIAFIPYNAIMEVFSQTDFNWKVPPSDHSTKEFQQLKTMVRNALEQSSKEDGQEAYSFNFVENRKELKTYISKNFKTDYKTNRGMRITHNNFVAIYNQWRKEVMPSISINWDKAKEHGLIDADFYLADLMSGKDNYTILQKLRVLLRRNEYMLKNGINYLGKYDTTPISFRDDMQAHKTFWARYARPPKEVYWDKIVDRRDLLVPQDVRERKGSYFTPAIWVEKSQEYLADVLGENWQDEYYVWDCCAGTGNLLANLTNKYNIWASTLDLGDVQVMHERIKHMEQSNPNGSNLLDRHVFQFDFLNDDLFGNKVPEDLKRILQDPEERKKLIIYINPPYAEVSSVNGGKKGVNQSLIHDKYTKILGTAGREVYTQFLLRIYLEMRGCKIAEFSTLKILQGAAFDKFRSIYKAELCCMFIVPGDTFDNVKGQFPIGFKIWDSNIEETFKEIITDVYEANGERLPQKYISHVPQNKFISNWVTTFKGNNKDGIAFLCGTNGNDFQHNNIVYILNRKEQMANPRGVWITENNLIECCVYFSVRKVIEANWKNDRDQFLYPRKAWGEDKEFQTDCLAYTLFNTNIQSQYGINHWIPFTEQELNAPDKFQSHFMSDFIAGKCSNAQQELEFAKSNSLIPTKPIQFSPEAQAVMNTGRELCPDSKDETYMRLWGNIKEALKVLAKKIEPKVYLYGFLLDETTLPEDEPTEIVIPEKKPIKTIKPKAKAKVKAKQEIHYHINAENISLQTEGTINIGEINEK